MFLWSVAKQIFTGRSNFQAVINFYHKMDPRRCNSGFIRLSSLSKLLWDQCGSGKVGAVLMRHSCESYLWYISNNWLKKYIWFAFVIFVYNWEEDASLKRFHGDWIEFALMKYFMPAVFKKYVQRFSPCKTLSCSIVSARISIKCSS